MNPPDEWNAEHYGKAKNSFNRAATEQTKTTQQGQGSDMVKNDKPTVAPPPPVIGKTVNQQLYQERLGKEHQAAKERNADVSRNSSKPVIDLKHQQEGSKIHERIKASRKEQDRGR